MQFIPGSGNPNPKLLILGDSPRAEDLKNGRNFTSSIGRELDSLLHNAGINRADCWLTTVSKYYVPPNKKDESIPFSIRAKNAGVNIQEQLESLQNEINNIRPNCILALGGPSLWATTGKTKISAFRGSILHGMGRKVVSTYNPGDLLYSSDKGEVKGYWNRQIIILDMKRAHQQAQFTELRLPQRILEVCNGITHFRHFVSQYKGLIPSVDIEAGGHCLPICIGLSFKKHHGFTIPLWNMDGISTISEPELAQIWVELAELLWTVPGIIGQNFNYDRDKLLRLGFRVRRVISDTMYKAFAINPEFPKGLAFNTSVYTEEPYYKDEGMYEGSYKDLFIGCARDACVTKEIDENMDADLDKIGQRKYYENFLMKLPPFYWGMEQQGFGIDDAERNRLLQKYIAWDEKLRYELFRMTEIDININSPKQVAGLLFDILKLPRKFSTGEEALTELINSPTVQKNPVNVRILENILEARRVRRTISNNIMALPDYDGRLRTTYFPCLETGRSSTGMQEPPIRPSIELRDENWKKKNKALGFPFQTITKHGDVGADIRGMLIP